MSVAIRIEDVSKLYRLGTVGTGTISHDLNRWWHRIRGKEDPYAEVGQVNDRTNKSSVVSRQSTDSSTENCQLTTANSRSSGPDYVWALKDINFEVEQGEILGIIGRNGAGKSTLLKLLSRVTAPTTGCIKTKGRIASLLEVGTGFHPELTGRENIYLNGAILGMKRYEIKDQLEPIAEFSGCARYLDTPVKRYSSGMNVRLGFAVAAHLACEVLIVDEVLAVGDADFQMKCISKMEEVSTSSNRSVLVVSHNMGTIRSLCKKALLLSDGQSLGIMKADDAINQYCGGNSVNLSHFRQAVMVDKPASISEAWVQADNGVQRTEFGWHECVTVVMRWRNKSANLIYPNIAIENERGVFVLASVAADSASAGFFESRVIIPARLLNSGHYALHLALDGRNPRNCYDSQPQALRFDVRLTDQQFTAVNPVRSTMSHVSVLPQLTWRSQQLSANPVSL